MFYNINDIELKKEQSYIRPFFFIYVMCLLNVDSAKSSSFLISLFFKPFSLKAFIFCLNISNSSFFINLPLAFKFFLFFFFFYSLFLFFYSFLYFIFFISFLLSLFFKFFSLKSFIFCLNISNSSFFINLPLAFKFSLYFFFW